MHEAGIFIAFPGAPLEQCDITAIEFLNVAFTAKSPASKSDTSPRVDPSWCGRRPDAATIVSRHRDRCIPAGMVLYRHGTLDTLRYQARQDANRRV